MDKRALKILFDTYWSTEGWRQGDRSTSHEDLVYAKHHGVMFDPLALTHDQVIFRLRDAASRLTERQVADGFLASLSTRRLDWRSALGSFFAARWLPAHKASEGALPCTICGLHPDPSPRDLNVLNFERCKWGGVRHLQPVYSLLDLELFLETPPPAPTEEDVRLFNKIIAAIDEAAAHVTASGLQSLLTGTFKANKAERDVLVGLLGICGILGTKEHPGFGDHHVAYDSRALPDRHFVDMQYPACWWTGNTGLNQRRLRSLFGHVLPVY